MKDLQKFKFWTQQTLPQVYDDSLSFYELLNKVVAHLNKIGDSQNELWEAWSDISNWVQGEINAALKDLLVDSNLFDKLSHINVLIFGADNRGKKCTSKEIQAALDFIYEKGGGTVYVPSGDYLICDTLIIRSNTHLLMSGGAVLKRTKGMLIMNGGHPDEPNFNPTGYNGHSNITIEGGTLSTNLEEIEKYPTTGTNMSLFGNCSNITIKNVTYLNSITFHCLDMNGINGLVVENCRFLGFVSRDPESSTTPREAIQLGEAQYEEFGKNDFTPCINVVVRDCIFDKSDIAGYRQVAVGNHYTRYGVWQENIRLLNNTVNGCTEHAFRPYSWRNVLIDGNRFNGCHNGVQISNAPGGFDSSKTPDGVQTNIAVASEKITITNNQFTDIGAYGVYTAGQFYNATGSTEISKPKKIKISGNLFESKEGSQTSCIGINMGEDIIITENTFDDVYRAVRLYGCVDVNVMNNMLENATSEFMITATNEGSGIVVYNERLQVSDNNIKKTHKTSLYLDAVKKSFVHGNTFQDAALLNDGTNRGCIFVPNSSDIGINNNFNFGSIGNSYFINVPSTSNNVSISNNGGVGTIYAAGATNKIGRWDVDEQGQPVLV